MTCADAAVAAEVAAIAAAAIASGAVAVVDAGGVAGTLVGAVVTGIATATGFGAATATGCAGVVGSSAVASLVGFLADFWSPAFAVLEFAWDGWASPFALASESCLAEVSSEPFCAAWLAAVVLVDCVLFAAADASSVCEAGAESSERLCDAVWVGVVAGAALASAAALLSSSAPKLSGDCDWSDREDRCGGLWNGTFDAASDATLYTGGLSR